MMIVQALIDVPGLEREALGLYLKVRKKRTIELINKKLL